MNATVEKIFVTKTRREQPQEISTAKLEAGKGIIGDRYHGGALEILAVGDEVPANHISLISKEELDSFLERNNAEIDYVDFRRNILTSGIDLYGLIGKQFKLGNTLCQGVEDCEPCAFLAATVHRAVLPDLEKKAGLRAIILEDGELKVGDTIIPTGD
ncbi:MAG: MOSC domain-containing protein [Gammaproteobacteria bacterium]|nr:MOSC domain-containing protein [Gammaproteobacteria bacterium]